MNWANVFRGLIGLIWLAWMIGKVREQRLVACPRQFWLIRISVNDDWSSDLSATKQIILKEKWFPRWPIKNTIHTKMSPPQSLYVCHFTLTYIDQWPEIWVKCCHIFGETKAPKTQTPPPGTLSVNKEYFVAKNISKPWRLSVWS